MSKAVSSSASFRRDVRRGMRRGLDTDHLWEIIDMLASGVPLPRNARRHRLTGNWAGRWECHIAGDWLLVWTEDVENVYLERTGTHADIFGG